MTPQEAFHEAHRLAQVADGDYLTNVLAALATLGYEVRPQESGLRAALWLSHGHDFIYGDDGEMQCNWGPHITDFLRDPEERLIEHCRLARAAIAGRTLPCEYHPAPPVHDCLMPSACGVTGFYCANSKPPAPDQEAKP